VSIPVFPSEIPITIQLKQMVEALNKKQKLGDGYNYVTQFGLHPIKETWRVNITIMPENLPELTAFLEERAMDGLPFFWLPPDGYPTEEPSEPDPSTQGIPWLWTVEQWSTPRTVRGRVFVDLTFRRRFDHVMDL
jgi:phage-related protein